ncbi:MAG: hypothetical protein Q9219_001165 [cf. Caloplaca sp. 3 TL-2023]
MSASPADSPNAIQASAQPVKSEKEQITFRFCRECSNMLYAKEDRINNKLMFACRTCQYSEDASSACVFRNSIYNIIGETAGVTQDVGSDPTVGLPDVCCTLCGQAIMCDFCDVIYENEIEADESSSDGNEEDDDHGKVYLNTDREGKIDGSGSGSTRTSTAPMIQTMVEDAKVFEPFADFTPCSYRDRT